MAVANKHHGACRSHRSELIIKVATKIFLIVSTDYLYSISILIIVITVVTIGILFEALLGVWKRLVTSRICLGAWSQGPAILQEAAGNIPRMTNITVPCA